MEAESSTATKRTRSNAPYLDHRDPSSPRGWPYSKHEETYTGNSATDRSIQILGGSNNNYTFNSYGNGGLSDDPQEMLRWLHSTDPIANHEKAKKKHEPGTGNWLFNSREFQNWKGTSGKTLWLYGIPGCGKTVLSSVIVEHLRPLCLPKSGKELIFYYFDFNDPPKQEVPNLLRSFLVQISKQRGQVPPHIKKLYHDYAGRPSEIEATILLEVLISVLENGQVTYIVIDALDECAQREELFDMVSTLQKHGKNIQLLVTSREEQEFRARLSDFNLKISVEAALVDEDIHAYVKTSLSSHWRMKNWSSDVKNEIEDALIKNSHGMFQWAFCQIDILKGCIDTSEVKDCLNNLPKTLFTTYERILRKIPDRHRKKVETALRFLAFSERPVSIGEISEAMIVDRESQSFNPQTKLLDIDIVLEICSVLVGLSTKMIIEDSHFMASPTHPNVLKERRILEFSHYSIKEYLISLWNESVSDLMAVKRKSHSLIAETCLIYLLSFNTLDEVHKESCDEHPLLRYSVEYWHIHAVADEESSLGLSLRFFDNGSTSLVNWARLFGLLSTNLYLDYEQVATSGLLSKIYEGAWRLKGFGFQKTLYATPLSYASFCGLPNLTRHLIEQGAELEETREDAATALHWAAASGQLKSVQILISARANLEAKTANGMTALAWSCFYGHTSVMTELLAAGADRNVRAQNGQTLLHLSAMSRNGDLVARLLIDQGADINAFDDDKQTAIFNAIQFGNERMLEYLLRSGANANLKNVDGYAPLHIAAEGSQTAAVKTLLKHGVDRNLRTDDGITALDLARSNTTYFPDAFSPLQFIMETLAVEGAAAEICSLLEDVTD